MKATGQIISVKADQLAYAVNDVIRLDVHAKITYEPSVWDVTGWWYLYIEVRNSAGEVVGTGSRSQTIALWTGVDYADEQLTINCGRFSHSDTLTVNLFFVSAKSIPLIYTGAKTQLDTRKVWITVAEVSLVPPTDGDDIPDGKVYQCQICGMVFFTQVALNSHIAEMHAAIPAPTYKCPYCGRIFTTQAALEAHIASAHPEPVSIPMLPTPTPTLNWTWVAVGVIAILALTMIGKKEKW